jgi:ubiquinone biosynthesis protein UbiJ
VLLGATFEQLLNRRIEESTAAAERLAKLEGESLAIEVTGLGLTLVLEARGARVRVTTRPRADVSATLRGSPIDLLRLLERAAVAELKQSGAELSGNLHVAEAFAEALAFAKPEVEAELADWIGDVAAHRVGAFGRRFWRFGRDLRRSLEFSTADYLKEEARALPGRLEVRAFVDEVDRLRDDVERAAKRLERVAGRRGTPD